MAPQWQDIHYRFNYYIGDKLLFSLKKNLFVHELPLEWALQDTALSSLPDDQAMQGQDGVLIRCLPSQDLLSADLKRKYLYYVSEETVRHYIQMRELDFEAYAQSNFSSKTRSTIRRKVNKYRKHCGDQLLWRSYKTSQEFAEFHRLALEVSRQTYQHKLFDGGLPEDESFTAQMQQAAADDRVRAYILFDGDKPVSYLYLPIEEQTLVYAFLGYLPDYAKLSVGTVLQWLALEELFAEGRYAYFDFTAGEGSHKALFSNGQVNSINVFLLKRTLKNRLLIRSHKAMNGFSEGLGRLLDRLGIKQAIKRLIRRSA